MQSAFFFNYYYFLTNLVGNSCVDEVHFDFVMGPIKNFSMKF